jgi:hypothetical protein
MEGPPLEGDRSLPEADRTERNGAKEIVLSKWKHCKQSLHQKEGGMKAAILIIGVLVLMGCAQLSQEISQQTDVPVMPMYSTESERVCGRDCQGVYAQCSHGCSQFPVFDAPAHAQRVTCFNNCNQTLKDCYSSCEKAP